MAEHSQEKRSVFIQMKIAPTLKEKAQERAKEKGRSLSNYIEWLIINDLKGRKKDTV